MWARRYRDTAPRRYRLVREDAKLAATVTQTQGFHYG